MRLAALSVLHCGANAGIRQKSEEIDNAAVQFLISFIHHNERVIPEKCREALVEGRWQDGSALLSRTQILQRAQTTTTGRATSAG